jgi:hypothetical protein
MKNQKFVYLYIFAIAILLTSCKAYRNLENINPRVSKENQAVPFDKNELKKLIPGDQIVVESTSGFKQYLIYQNFTEDKLVGSVWKEDQSKPETPKSIEIPFEEIEQVRVRRVSAAATVPLAVFAAMGVLFGIYAIAVSSGGGYL